MGIFLSLKLEITSATLGSKHNTIINATLMQVLDVVTGTSKEIKTNN